MLNRWLGTAALLAVFLLRIVLAQGVSFTLVAGVEVLIIIFWNEQWYIGSYWLWSLS